MDSPTSCELCERTIELTFHHLIPKKTHKRGYIKKQFEKLDMNKHGIYICKDCHGFIHRKIDHTALGLEFNSKEKLLAHPEINRFVSWVKKQRKRAKR